MIHDGETTLNVRSPDDAVAHGETKTIEPSSFASSVSSCDCWSVKGILVEMENSHR